MVDNQSGSLFLLRLSETPFSINDNPFLSFLSLLSNDSPSAAGQATTNEIEPCARRNGNPGQAYREQEM